MAMLTVMDSVMGKDSLESMKICEEYLGVCKQFYTIGEFKLRRVVRQGIKTEYVEVYAVDAKYTFIFESSPSDVKIAGCIGDEYIDVVDSFISELRRLELRCSVLGVKTKYPALVLGISDSYFNYRLERFCDYNTIIAIEVTASFTIIHCATESNGCTHYEVVELKGLNAVDNNSIIDEIKKLRK